MEITKEVHPFSLFYDLVFVYAIACMTQVIEHAQGGWITAGTLFSYLLGAFAVLQSWIYQANFANRFGQQRWYENLVRAVNMMSVLYLANNLGHDQVITGFRFSLLMIIMIGDIALLYYIRSKAIPEHSREALSFAKSTAVVTIPYWISLACYALGLPVAVSLFFTTAGVLAGFGMPFVMKQYFDTELVDFHHLTERFELLTILSFGETILAVGKWFRPDEFGLNSVLAFAVILSLFACYYFQMHILIDRSDHTRGLVLLYSHYLIIMGLDLLAAGQNLLLEHEILAVPFSILTGTSLILYFAGLFANSVYYSHKIWNGAEKLAIPVILLAGTASLLLLHQEHMDLVVLLVTGTAEALLLFFQARKVGFDE